MTDAEILAAFKLEKLPRDLLAPPVLWADEGFSKRQIRVLQAAVELGRRALTQAIPVPTKLSRSLDAARVMQPRLKGLIHEEFWVLVLNAALGLRATVRVASGGLTQCSVLPREVLAPALIHGAPAIMTMHNHPSGDPTPSVDDHRLFSMVDEACRTMGIRRVDHLIMGREQFWSQAEGFSGLTYAEPQQVA